MFGKKGIDTPPQELYSLKSCIKANIACGGKNQTAKSGLPANDESLCHSCLKFDQLDKAYAIS